MKYLDFKKSFQNMPVILSQDLVFTKESQQNVLNQIRRWQKRGLLSKLKKGVYILNKYDRKITPSRMFIANALYGPSYISLEYALNFYSLIPEGVVDVTSVTTRKTKTFSNEFGTFVFRHMQKKCLRGFISASDEAGLSYFIAEPEKAVVDFLYFNLNAFQDDFLKVFEESFRFQNTGSLKKDKILKWAQLFNERKLLRICRQFIEFRRKENQ